MNSVVEGHDFSRAVRGQQTAIAMEAGKSLHPLLERLAVRLGL